MSTRPNDVYSTQRRLFACLGELPTKGLPQVAEIPDEAFASRRSIRAMMQLEHVTHLGGIYLLRWKTKPCERAMETAETEYVELACRGLNVVPPD